MEVELALQAPGGGVHQALTGWRGWDQGERVPRGRPGNVKPPMSTHRHCRRIAEEWALRRAYPPPDVAGRIRVHQRGPTISLPRSRTGWGTELAGTPGRFRSWQNIWIKYKWSQGLFVERTRLKRCEAVCEFKINGQLLQALPRNNKKIHMCAR